MGDMGLGLRSLLLAAIGAIAFELARGAVAQRR
jgi:hypothetical protein